MNFDIRGEADSKQALDHYLPMLSPYVSGHSPFAVQFVVQKGLENLVVSSSLQGVSILAPAPAGKQAADVLPLSLRVTPGKPLSSRYGWIWTWARWPAAACCWMNMAISKPG
jgi:uncharacterized protein YhdP